jgi:hypothetical protein
MSMILSQIFNSKLVFDRFDNVLERGSAKVSARSRWSGEAARLRHPSALDYKDQ